MLLDNNEVYDSHFVFVSDIKSISDFDLLNLKSKQII